MIQCKAHLFWCGGPISYLRYLTFATLRHFHPNWHITLHTSTKFVNATWVHEAQDFQHPTDKDYTEATKRMVNDVRPYTKHPNIAPNFQSDFFRWDILSADGGFYLDTDQIILKPFDDLLGYDFIYALYESNGPVGVLGSSTGSLAVQYIQKSLASRYHPDNYNSIGPQMFMQVMAEIGNSPWFKQLKSLNSNRLFYPIGYSHDTHQIYDGSFNIPDTSYYALHWFGGHPNSQAFNKKFTEDFARTSNDTISRFLRSIGIVKTPDQKTS